MQTPTQKLSYSKPNFQGPAAFFPPPIRRKISPIFPFTFSSSTFFLSPHPFLIQYIDIRSPLEQYENSILYTTDNTIRLDAGTNHEIDDT